MSLTAFSRAAEEFLMCSREGIKIFARRGYGCTCTTRTAFDSSAGRTIALRPQALCQHGSGMFQTTCIPGVPLNTDGSTPVYGALRGTHLSSVLGSTKSHFLKSGKICRFVVIFICWHTQRDNHHTLNRQCSWWCSW